ncbi:MAG: DsbA family protein [Burkholderiaceae bacterium]
MDWYFDVISPYAYLQSTRLQELNAAEPVRCVPVLFAGLLDHWDNIGPAEVAPKRLATFRTIAWVAARDGIALKLPPRHPFNPLPLLRASQALNNDLKVVQRLFRFVWAEGHTPEDAPAFDALLAELGLNREAIAADSVKSALREHGERAIAQGVFGVPSLVIDDQVFWGDDATDIARSYLASRTGQPAPEGQPAWPAQAMAAAAALPEGKSRPRIDRSASVGAGAKGTGLAPAAGPRILCYRWILPSPPNWSGRCGRAAVESCWNSIACCCTARL